MASNFEDFVHNALVDIAATRHAMGEGSRKAFVQWMNEHSFDEEAENIELVYLEAKYRNRNVGVEGYFYNDAENTLVLVIADWDPDREDKEARLTKTQADSYFKRLRTFFEMSSQGLLQDPAAGIIDWSSPEYGLADMIQNSAFDRVRLVLYTDRKLSERFKTLSSEPLGDIPVEQTIWSFDRIWEFVKSGKEHEPLELSFEECPIPLTLATTGNGFKSYLGVIGAEKLATLYREHGGRLLEGNVRSYLTLKSAVNRDIKATILREPEHFFIYNNGIAVTAHDLVFDKKGRLIQATDFQIINGGQTTASLARAVHTDKADVSNIKVALKLTEVDQSLDPIEARQLVRNISRYSNNQNKVSGADFSSNHEFHVLMEQYANRIPAPPAPGKLHSEYWFYERNRGSYLQTQMFMTESEKTQFEARSNKKHKVQKEEFARARLIWEEKPHIVSKGASSLFSVFMEELDSDWEEERRKGSYGEDYFKDSIALWIMYQDLRTAVKAADWYDKGYLANIVTYAMAVLSWRFKLAYPKEKFNLGLIWQKQTVSEPLLELLLEISQIVKDCLTDPHRLQENVTEWAKMPECWKRIMQTFDRIGFALPANFNTWCCSRQEVKEARETAKEIAKVDASVDIMKKAYEYQYWQEAVQFEGQHRVLTPKQDMAMRHCMMIPKKFPTERELKLAWEGLEELRMEGFKF